MDFHRIEQAAVDRAGGRNALEQRLIKPEPPESLAMVGDDRYLSVMCRRIFRAGLTHRLVDARWPAFEIAFQEFDIERVARLADDELKQLSADESLIRHRKKIHAVRDNAAAMCDIVDEHGSFGFWLAEWPDEDIVRLWHELTQRFTQLGGHSAPSFLRMAGKDTFLLTDWVTRALAHWNVHTGGVKARKAHAELQAIFNAWHEQTGRYHCQLSQILAFSIA